MSFSPGFAGGEIDLYPLCYSSQKSLSPLCDWCSSFYHHSGNGNFHSRRGWGFNIVKSLQMAYNKKNNGTYSVLSGSSFCANLPSLSVCEKMGRKAFFWYAGRYGKQRHRAARYHLCVDATRSRVVKSIWPPSLRDYGAEQNKNAEGEKKWKVDIDQMACSNKLGPASRLRIQ